MVDNIRMGLPEAMGSFYSPVKAPAKDGVYEVFLNGKKVAQTSSREYLFQNLEAGTYTAGVRRAYTSGFSGMAYIDFTLDKGVDNSGIETAETDNGIFLHYSNHTLTIDGEFNECRIFDASGMTVMTTTEAKTNLGTLAPGLYIAKAIGGKSASVIRFIVD